MKIVLLSVISALFVNSAMAAIPDATKISVLTDQNGRPAFGMQFSKRPSPIVAITFSVRGDQLVGAKASPINPAYWAIINKETGSLLSSWSDTQFGGGYVNPDASEAFSVSLEGNSAMTVMNNIRKTAVVLSLKNAASNLKPTVYLDLAELCNSDPDGFMDLDSGRLGCPK